MTGRPLLVLVHGTRFDARCWAGYPELLPEAEVRAVDLPGHGTLAGAAYSTQAALGVLEEAIGSVGADTPVVLAGHSLGGYVATSFAGRDPERLDALVLIGACADPARHPLLARSYSGFARLLPVIGPERMSRVANLALRGLGLRAGDLPDATGYAVTPQAWAAVAASAGPHELRQVSCPVYLVAGQFDQMRVDIDRYARACRDPRVRLIRRASHLAPLTHRDAVAAVLREAVRSVCPPG